MEPKLFVATKAFITYQGKILVLQESNKYADGTNASKYDVVGGRIQPGERFDDALRREVLEETGLAITIGKPFFVNEWRPTVKDEPWQIVGIFFECTAEADHVTLSTDHSAYAWIDPKEYMQANVIPNLYPVFEAYLKR